MFAYQRGYVRRPPPQLQQNVLLATRPPTISDTTLASLKVKYTMA